MNTSCPVCGKEFSLFDRLSQPTVCGACYKEGKTTPAKLAVVNSSEAIGESDDPVARSVGKFGLRFVIRLIGGLVIVPLLFFANHLSDVGSKYAALLTFLVFAGVFAVLIVSYVLPVLLVDKRMGISQALLTVTLIGPVWGTLRAIFGPTIQHCRKRPANPFTQETKE